MGLILGLVFGPIGLILVLMSGINAPQLELRGLKRGRLTKCPVCSRVVYAKEARCRFCGHEFR